MSPVTRKTSRRDFVLNGGATLGAGVAAAATAGAALSGDGAATQEQLARKEDVEAIRRVHAQFVAAVESTTLLGAGETHRAYRANARQIEDTLTVSRDRLRATASWNVDVQMVTPLQGDSTLAQMARLQGSHGDVRWETGRLEARYARERDEWRMTELQYVAA